MSLLDEQDILIKELDSIVYKKYFDNTNTIISGIEFDTLLDSVLDRCRSRRNGSFVYCRSLTSRMHFIFVKDGVIRYCLNYQSYSFRSFKDQDGLIIKEDYMDSINPPKFTKYFQHKDDCHYYKIDEEWLNKFYNIIFKNDNSKV